MKKRLFAALAALIAAVAVPGAGVVRRGKPAAVGAGDKVCYASELAGADTAVSASIAVTANKADPRLADEYTVSWSVSMQNGSAPPAGSRVIVKIIKKTGASDYGEAGARYLGLADEKAFDSASAAGSFTFSRAGLKFSDGTLLCGAFTAALFTVRGGTERFAAKANFTVEPVASIYTGSKDFSDILGSNYVPADAVSQLDMWINYAKFREDIEFELKAASELGLNTLRVFLHDLAYVLDKAALLKNIEHFLTTADKNGFKTMFVFFDDCHQTDKDYALDFTPPFAPQQFKWSNSPFPEDRVIGNYGYFEDYVKDIVSAYKDDGRIFAWNAWNEPWWGIIPNGGKGSTGTVNAWYDVTNDLLKNSFNWIRQAGATQPVSSVYQGKPYSDMDERHTYGEIGTSSHVPYFDTEPITAATVYTEAGNRAWGSTNNSCGSPMEYLHWLNGRREAGLPTPGIFFAWELFDSSTNVNFARTPLGIVEPPIPSAGLLFWDGTPVSLTEVVALNKYSRGADLGYFYDDFNDRTLDEWTQKLGAFGITQHPYNTSLPWTYNRIADLVSDGADTGLLLRGEDSWTDYVAEGTVVLKNVGCEGAGFMLRADENGDGYYVGFNFQEVFIKKISGGAAVTLASKQLDVRTSNVFLGWHNMLRVSVNGGVIKVYLNPYGHKSTPGEPLAVSSSDPKAPVLAFTDESPISSGRVGIRTEKTWAQFDDFSVMPFENAKKFIEKPESGGSVPPPDGKVPPPAVYYIIGVVGGAAVLGGAAVTATVILKKKKRVRGDGVSR